MILRLGFLLVSGALLHAQNATPRAKATDYPIHAELSSMEAGVEYLVHSIPGEGRYYFAKDYLVIEIGAFPSTRDGVAIFASQFTLLVNSKTVLYTVSPGMVASSMKHPDWARQRGVVAQAGNDNATITLGAPAPTARFPGDPGGNVPVNTPRPPQTDDGKDLGKQPERPLDEAIAVAALPEGRADKPVRGCLFFYFEGKTKSIKSLALVYEPGGRAPKATIPIL
ncbi:MAG TPA: hypothetical protein VGV35_02455 [Bryobacteraceae bacterium]|nr:hypothetical protein [Bryobacteraceae bacterium]